MNYIELNEWFKELEALNEEVKKHIWKITSSRCTTGKATNV